MTRVAAVGAVLRGRASARQIALLYLVLLFAAIAVGLLRWPIVAVDTDLWYHLNAGRQMAAERALPAGAFFSFLRPSPVGLDYYWLAQLGLYGTHALGGPVALVWLRAALALATLGFALASLRTGRPRESLPYAAFVFTLAGLYVLVRFTAIRPHAASYLLIAVFLYLLESRRALLALPVLALLWANLHGIEYPVMLLILGAYTAEWLLARIGAAPAARPATPRELAAVAVAIACVLGTPHGLALLAAPFAAVSFASQYIAELRPVDPGSLLSFGQEGLLVTRETLRSLLLLLAGVAALASLRRATLRPAHLLLLAGGIALLARMERFSIEFTLLALPLLGAFRPPALAFGPPPIAFRPPLIGQGELPRWLASALIVLAVCLPFRYLGALFDARCTFPVCTRDLPTGAVAFLTRVGATGDVLNHPNHGGYLEWELFPRQKIFVDLQTPFLFPDGAVFAADQAFQDPVVLGALVAAYHPAFLVVPNKLRGFEQLVASFPDYAPVFVDDAAVLYASSGQNPELVMRYRLREIEPFSLQPIGARDDPETLGRTAAELRRLIEIHPEGGRTGILEGALALERGDTDTALRRADLVMGFYGDRPEPYRLRAEALFRAKRLAEAAEAFRAALARLGSDPASVEQRRSLEGQLWACLLELGRPEEAYQAARRALPDVYAPGISYKELAALARTALESGREQEGRRLAEFALQKAPPQETVLRAWLEKQLEATGEPR